MLVYTGMLSTRLTHLPSLECPSVIAVALWPRVRLATRTRHGCGGQALLLALGATDGCGKSTQQLWHTLLQADPLPDLQSMLACWSLEHDTCLRVGGDP